MFEISTKPAIDGMTFFDERKTGYLFSRSVCL